MDAHAAFRAHAAFWQDAGVDHAFTDDARDWLADNAAKQQASDPAKFPPPVAPPPPRALGPAPVDAPDMERSRGNWPATLDEFAAWWLSEPTLDSGAAAQRVPPRGPFGAKVMLIVAEPEAQDRERLLSGPDGALFDAIERAMGLDPGAAYRASALPRATPAADWEAIAAAGMGAVLRHHVSLVMPERLLVLSQEAGAQLAPDRFDSDGTGIVKVGGREIPLMAAYPLQQMIPRPGHKRIFWKRWLAFASGH
ncbi:hypothetical protein EKN06_04520 [Croceicoccus ponticola]|uniref:Uracil-DNA glycosylase-like domain-containing protein n=1 Tax=Croceicoccus ponticola TaxID=2217664 RepID=A0A437H1Q0_9SPHN|nr:hypothetical protein [Croceicoccus ponticola]RVQ69443.1 hypothetical protein EKN06_04520 [Croceicoccus ponticola]